MRVFFWIEFPCPFQMNVYHALASFEDVKVYVVCERGLDEERVRRYGWKTNTVEGFASVEILPSTNWKDRVWEILQNNRNAVHIFGSLLKEKPKAIAYARDLSMRMKLATGIISECPTNTESSTLKRIAKAFLLVTRRSYVRKIVRRADLVLAIPRRRTLDYLKLPSDNQNIYSFGYFVERLFVNKNHSCFSYATSDAHDTDNEQVKFLYVGAFTRNKRIDLLIRAMRDLRRKHGDQFSCFLVGEGPLRKRMMRKSIRYGLQNNLSFLGAKTNEEVRLLMKGCDAVILTHNNVSWGVPVLEAIVSGLAVFVSNGDGASELISRSGSGKVFRRGDYRELCVALSEYLDSVALRQRMKEKALEFSDSISLESVSKYLRRILETFDQEKAEKPQPPWQ